MTEEIIAEEITPTVETPVKKIEEGKFVQADIDRIVKERLSREHAIAKKVSDEANAQIVSLNQAIESYEKTLNELLEPQMADIPDAYKALLNKLSPLEKLEWLSKNPNEKMVKKLVPITPKSTGEEKPRRTLGTLF
jgi:hypothetical protein